MKKRTLKIVAIVLAMVLILATFASCGQQGEQGPAGPQGEQGIQGDPGVNGTNGVDGESAYELAVDKGYTGTVEEWLASLVGEVGATGQAGANGQSAYEIAVKNGYTGTETEWLASLVGASGSNGSNGSNGTNGKSAYELACNNGFEGSLSEWLDSLVGKDGVNGTNGTNGKSAYELACENGFEGSLTEWLASLVGAAGKDGANGTNGTNGANGKSAYELAVEKGYDGDLQTWLASLVGAKGDDGKSAYEIAVDNGYEGTEEEWLASLVGEKGDDGLSAFEIYQKYHPEYTGTEEEWIESLKGEQGVSITNAYVDENLHLWIVLSNGTKIDAGYVGVTVTPTPTTYTVTFVDYNGTTLKTETVESGKSATAPADPTRSGYRFTGWDVAYNNITSNTTVTAQYIQQFTVTFKDYNGNILKTQTVDKGANATPPTAPSRNGYEFASWNGTYTNVTTNQVVTATYTQNAPTATYTVTFYDYDGTTVLGTSTVAEGKAATPPANPSKAGADFLGWNGNFINVRQNESVVAVYDDSKNIFTVESATGNIGDTVTLLVSIDGKVKTCGFDITIYYDNAILELVTYDSDLDLDVVVNTEYLENGVLLNFSAATEKTKSREIIELTFRIKDTTAGATSVYVEMTSIKEMDGSTIIDSTCEFVEGVVTIQ